MLARLVASGCGVGYVPVAAGTVASAVAVLLGMTLLQGGPLIVLAMVVVATLAGVWAVRAAHVGEDDPGWVVIDEFAGQWLALVGLAHPSWRGLLLAFLLFRVLDVTKLGPIGWADRRHDAAGVMADDLIAGAAAAALLWVGRAIWPGLLG